MPVAMRYYDAQARGGGAQSPEPLSAAGSKINNCYFVSSRDFSLFNRSREWGPLRRSPLSYFIHDKI